MSNSWDMILLYLVSYYPAFNQHELSNYFAKLPILNLQLFTNLSAGLDCTFALNRIQEYYALKEHVAVKE